MHEYDVTLKLLLQGSAQATMRELTGSSIAEWLNVELPKFQNLRVDLLGRTPDEQLVHLELQSGNDPRMAYRMAEYAFGVHRLFGRFPRQVLVYVGEEELNMPAQLDEADLFFRYRVIDMRDMDGERLLASDHIGDNVVAILARLHDRRTAVREIIAKISGAESGQREFYLGALLTLAGLCKVANIVEQEAKHVPILNDILDHEVLGREFKKGLRQGVSAVLRRVLEKRFGPIPSWAEERLAGRSVTEMEDLVVRVLDAEDLRELLR